MFSNMTKVISLFNHKGGVSKTTTVFHLGWKMASLGKKVLIVDADPQCNLTGLALGLEDYNSLFAFYDSKQNTDIFNSLAPIFALESETITSSSKNHSVASTKNKNLFILAGNIRFSEIDVQIATALTSSGTIPVLKRFVGAINHLIRSIARQHGFDVVLIDMSPSVSATNHCILMGSDYFIVPISPDFYCYQAIDSLSTVLPNWAASISSFQSGTDGYALPEQSPKMLGYISQNYRIYTTGQNEDDSDQKTMSKAYKEWLDKIKDLAANKLVPSLEKANMIVDRDLFRKSVSYDNPYHLAGIQNFNTLIPVSQKLSKPIYELKKDDHNWAGAVWNRTDNGRKYGVEINIQEADKVYTNFAESIIKMIQ